MLPGMNPPDVEMRGKERNAEQERLVQQEMARRAVPRQARGESLIARLLRRLRGR